MSHRRESYHNITQSCRVAHEWGMILHLNASCSTRMSHVTYEWVMSHIHTRTSNVAQEGVITYLSDSCHTWMSHVTHKRVVPRVNELCYTTIMQFWLFWHHLLFDSSRDKLVTWHIDQCVAPPTFPRGSFFLGDSISRGGRNRFNETPATKLN